MHPKTCIIVHLEKNIDERIEQIIKTVIGRANFQNRIEEKCHISEFGVKSVIS